MSGTLRVNRQGGQRIAWLSLARDMPVWSAICCALVITFGVVLLLIWLVGRFQHA